MSIKVKLLLSYILMTFLPVVLFALITTGLSLTFYGDKENGGTTPFWEQTNERNDWVAGVRTLAKADPERFTDSAFLNRMDQLLSPLQIGLVVVKNDRMVYSSPSVDRPGLEEELRRLEPDEPMRKWKPNAAGRYAAERHSLSFPNGGKGDVYILTDWSSFFQGMRQFFPLLLLTLLVVIGLTNGLVTFLVSRNLIRPLYRLKNAAEQIKEGNLNHEIRLNRKDEIGRLGEALEEMRSRLNESIRLQLQYEENRKELISNISHDLKTPITGIQACVDGIRDGIADTSAKRDKYIGMIARKTEEMDRLIDELFLFSKLDLKRLPFHPEPLDLNAYLQDYTAELGLDPRLVGVKVTYTSSRPGPVTVLADREKLERVLMNIIGNSLNYMDKPNKEIRVRLQDGPEEAVVSLEDNGPGIAESALPHIFDRFYRADPSRNTAAGGSGLGLAIVKQMIEGQGGAVGAESRLGQGTRLFFTLPKPNQEGKRS
ncbi:HAMP domain-containing histidine kinase [Paenibacillus sp. CC-CFT747]|nr:HAMP domain-containing histidine kinase [Paenibacillus sp. CC-CFT747]